MQKHISRITVVSEGLVFEGRRTPRAWVWQPTGPAPQAAPSVSAPSTQAASLLIRAGVPKEERREFGRLLGTLTVQQQRQLLGVLKRRLGA